MTKEQKEERMARAFIIALLAAITLVILLCSGLACGGMGILVCTG